MILALRNFKELTRDELTHLFLHDIDKMDINAVLTLTQVIRELLTLVLDDGFVHTRIGGETSSRLRHWIANPSGSRCPYQR